MVESRCNFVVTNRTLGKEALCPGLALAASLSLTAIESSGSEGYTHVVAR